MMSSELLLAGRFRRLVATLVDAVLVPALALLLLTITDVMEDADDYANVGLIFVGSRCLRYLEWLYALATRSNAGEMGNGHCYCAGVEPPL